MCCRDVYKRQGKFSVDVGVCFNEPHTIACVDTGKQAFFYIVDQDGNETLFLRADFDDDGMVRSYDAEGNLLDESQDYSCLLYTSRCV